MTQGVKVELFPFVVFRRQEIALSAFSEGFNVVLYFVEPSLAGFGEIGAEHVGNILFRRECEHGCRRCLHCDDLP